MKIGIFTMSKAENRKPNSVGSSRIRGSWLWKYWDEAEEYQIGRNYDAVIFQKSYKQTFAQMFEGIKVFDLCDADWLDPRPVFEMISYCDAAVTSTEPLAEYIRKLVDKPVICIPDRMDLEEMQPCKLRHEGEAKSVVWFGYSQNVYVLDKTVEHLRQRGLALTVISDAVYQPHKVYGEFKVNNVKYDYETVHKNIIEHDIVLLPPPEGLRGKYKSNNKIINSWAIGMPVALTPQDLDKFKTAEARNEEAKIRMREVRERWDVKISIGEWRELVKKLKEARDGKKSKDCGDARQRNP